MPSGMDQMPLEKIETAMLEQLILKYSSLERCTKILKNYFFCN